MLRRKFLQWLGIAPVVAPVVAGAMLTAPVAPGYAWKEYSMTVGTPTARDWSYLTDPSEWFISDAAEAWLRREERDRGLEEGWRVVTGSGYPGTQPGTR